MSRKKTKTPAAPIVRCGIYTRKSTEEGLDQKFNSLDAQRESGEACVKSQRHEGWVCKRRKGDSDAMAAFRARMRTEESKAILKQRPSIAEFPNAECRNPRAAAVPGARPSEGADLDAVVRDHI